MCKFKDLTGMKIGRLTVIGLDEERNLKERERYKNGETKNTKTYWLCDCDCGNKNISIRGSSLHIDISKGTKSCGCLQIEKSSKQNEYEEFDTYYKGWDTKHKHYFLISKEDYEKVSKYCWNRHTKRFYWSANSKGDFNAKNICLHQLIMMQIDNTYKPSKELVPDHLNRNKDDNRRCNLELKTLQGNSRNLSKPKNNTSGKQGVYFNKRDNKWVADIRNNEQKRIQKYFNTFEEAVEQRKQWEKEFGYIGE